MAQQVGAERFELGVKKAWNECRFFPTPPEIRERIPPPDMRPVGVPDESCIYCGGSGWKDSKGREQKDCVANAGIGATVVRCDCWRIEYVKASA